MLRRWLFSGLAGLAMFARAEDAPLVRVGDVWQYFKGVVEPTVPPLEWAKPGFLPGAGWLAGNSGFSTYHGNRDDENVLLIDRSYNYVSAYFRREFVVQDPAIIRWLILRLDYQEGFVAYLNGAEVHRRNLPGEAGVPVRYDALATVRTNVRPEEFDLTAHLPRLQPGTNVLAIQVHSDQLGPGFPFIPYGGDLACLAELLADFPRGPFVQNLTSTSVDVIWRTFSPTTGRVDYGTGPDLPLHSTDETLSTNHFVRLANLLPDSRYSYRVSTTRGGLTAVSEVADFRTLKVAGDVSFAVFGDSGSGLLAQHMVANAIRLSDPELVFHCGDIVYFSFDPQRADTRCLSAYRPHMRTTPYFFVLGNHDTYWAWSGWPATDAFSLPKNAVPAEVHAREFTSPEHYYSFDHGDVHFVALFNPSVWFYKFADSKSTQMKWLEADLAASKKPWKFLFMHMPVNSSSLHRFDDEDNNEIYDRIEIQQTLLPLAVRHGVQIIFAGHDHCFERFVPVNGVHLVTTGAGGAGLYGAVEWDPGSSQFYAAHHFLKVEVTGESVNLSAVGTNGVAFDQFRIQRAPLAPREYAANWASPRVEEPPPKPAVLNLNAQTWDFTGEAVPSLTGKFANLGRLRASLDKTNLYLGLERVMIPNDADVVMFLEVPGVAGVSTLAGLGNGIVDPAGQGADALDFLENLSFANFSPAIACVLGDEMADGTYRDFRRTDSALALGQGVFRLDAQFSSVPGTRVQQFDRSPQSGLNRKEQNADFIEVAIPRSQLGDLPAESWVKVAVLAVGAVVDTREQTSVIDSGYVGSGFAGGGENPTVIEGARFRLPVDPDPDNDGLSTELELSLGTKPDQADTDGDGLLDGWEIANRLHPLLAAGLDGGGGDVDGDGLTNADEQALGTNPRDANSRLRLRVSRIEGGRIRLEWPTMPGRTLKLESAVQSGGGFQIVEGALSGYEPPETTGTKFYRLRLETAVAP